MEHKLDRVKVFLSYSNSDSEWAERLLAHLNAADSKGLVEYWSDQKIEIGSEWKEQFEEAINEAKVFVILVSPDYMASPFSADVEFPRIRDAAEDGALIIPVLIKPVASAAIKGLQKYQFANAEAIQSLGSRQKEELIIEVAKRINTAIIDHKKKLESRSDKVLASVIGGAAIGSVIPVIGTGVGAILGGFIGGVIGSVSRRGRDDA